MLPRKTENKIRDRFKWVTLLTLGWILLLGIYWHWKHEEFRDLLRHPYEVGELLAGWFAPLAALLAAIAVMFQRQELMDQTIRLRERAVQNDLEHSIERLGMALQTLARTAEGCELHKRGEESICVSELIGRRQMCTELARSRNYSRLLLKVGTGLGDFADRVVKNGWVIDANEHVLDDFAVDVATLIDLGKRVEEASYISELPGDCPPKAELSRFLDEVLRASKCIRDIQTVYDSLGT